MKLRETISWLMGTLQRSLFPYFQECSGTPLTEKQKKLIQIRLPGSGLAIIHILD